MHSWRRVPNRLYTLTFILLISVASVASARSDAGIARPANAPEAAATASTNAANGTLRGRIVDEKGVPIKNVYVMIMNTSTNQYVGGDVVTGADGIYSASVPPGSYFMNAMGMDETRSVFNNFYLDTWYPNVWDADYHAGRVAATAVTVTEGGTTTADWILQEAAHITIVLVDSSGAPINVPAHHVGSATRQGCWGGMFIEFNGTRVSAPGCNDGDVLGGGVYRPYSPPRNRKLFFAAWPDGSNYLPLYWDGQLTLASATPVVVTDSTPITLTFRMVATGPTISGKLSFSSPLDSVSSASVSVERTDGLYSRFVYADPSALTFRTPGMPEGEYTLSATVRGKKGTTNVTYSKYYKNGASVSSATRIPVHGTDVVLSDFVMDTTTEAAALRTSTSRISLLAPAGGVSEGVGVPIWTETGDINWSATTSSSWIRISPSSGTAYASQGAKVITVYADATSLAAGTYTGTIVITGTSGAPINIPVSLEVTAPIVTGQLPAQLDVDSLAFTDVGTSFAPATVKVSNPGTQPLSWNLRSSLVTPYPASGTLEGGASAQVTVAAAGASLSFGSITGSLELLTGGQFTRAIPVTLNVAPIPAPVVRGASTGASIMAQANATDLTVTRVLPSIASNLGGQGNTKWSSDVFLASLPSKLATNLTAFTFTPFGSRNGANSLFVTGAVKLPMLTLASPIANLFRKESGFGALEMKPNSSIASWSRIYTMSADGKGSYGQEVPAFDNNSVIRSGETGTIPVLLGGAFRSNVLISEVGGASADVTVTIRDGAGTALKTQSVPLTPFEQTSIGDVLAGTSASGGYASVTLSGNGAVGAIASLVDNKTQDPTTVSMLKSASRTKTGAVIVPGVLHAAGGGSTAWRSDMWVVNASAAPIEVAPVLYPSGGKVSARGASHTIPPGAQYALPDVVLSAFARESDRGSIVLDVVSGDPAGLRVFSRTFNADPAGGTYGQGLRATESTDEVVSTDAGLVIFGLPRNRSFRSNLQIQETGGAPVTVEIRGEALPPAGGTVLTTPVATIGLAAYELRQIGDILGVLGLTNDAVNARVILKVISGSGSIAGYGSIVDNGTGDPTTVPAFRLSQ